MVEYKERLARALHQYQPAAAGFFTPAEKYLAFQLKYA
jgi:hypothetical protein